MPVLKRRELTDVSCRFSLLLPNNIGDVLYAGSVLSRTDNSEVNGSKLRREFAKLFPVNFKLFGIEFYSVSVRPYKLITIRSLELESERGRALAISLSFLQYGVMDGAFYISHRTDMCAPLVDLPEATSGNMFKVFGLKRVFVSQLTRIPGVRIESKGPEVEIALAAGAHTLTAFTRDCDAWLSVDSGVRIGYFRWLLKAGISCNHILKALFESATLVRYKHSWKQLVWQASQLDSDIMLYGSRRCLRVVPKFKQARAGGVLVKPVVSDSGKVLLKAGSEFSLSLELLDLIRVVYASDNISLILNTECCESATPVDTHNLSSISFSEAARALFNSITNQSCSSDVLSKRDLVFLWKRLISKDAHRIARDADVRIIKSCGDIILSWILFELKRALTLDLSTVQVLNDVINLGLKRIRFAVTRMFNTSELCQYAEQLNSLTELCHKLRLTYMGEGGVTFRTASDKLRDVQFWHFGKVCPVESPEGQNIGLVCSYSLFCFVSANGLIQTVLGKVRDGKLSNRIKLLDCFEAKNYAILVLNKKLAKRSSLCTFRSAVLSLSPAEVELCYFSAAQLFSPAVNLIPFLGHNDATRALMAANMQKQAVPLIKPVPPVVGTGLERVIIEHTHHNVCAVNNSLIVYADANKIVAYEHELGVYRAYELSRPWCTNQGSCFRVRTVVQPGQLVGSGQDIAECQSSAQSEISLGTNLLVAFMVWNGLNYEDSVVLSEDAVARGVLQSLHMLEHEVKLYNTLLGEEVLVDVSNSEQCLTWRGAVRVGSIVYPGDILVGKLTPVRTGYDQITYTDTSYRLPLSSDSATVVSVQFSTDNFKDQQTNLSYCTMRYNAIRKTYAERILTLLDDNELIYCDYIECDIFCYVSTKLSVQRSINNLYNRYCEEIGALVNSCSDVFGGTFSGKIKTSSTDSDLVEVVKIKLLVRRSVQAGDKVSGRHGNKGVISRVVCTADMPYMADGTPIDMILNPLSVPSRMNLGQVLEAHLGLVSYKWGLEFKRIIELYNEVGFDSELIKLAKAKLSELYLDVDFSHYDNAAVIKLIQEARTGIRFACHPFVKPDEAYIELLSKRVGLKLKDSMQIKLYNGRTGAAFDRKITVGSVYILKLNHMVDDKLHARSTGPYSIVTQQPLKGKAHEGGQRLGEMEVWALQAYGASFLLKEALTVKSDDVEGREKISNSILHNKVIMQTTWNESFLVLIREMCSLCLNVKLNVNYWDHAR
ncbi:MAG: hypothetical protein AAJB65_00565 [Candidatus Hodgkinia cicadicola]